jgi:lipoprotein-anchoring transpeptidase ErfK/SrfK
LGEGRGDEREGSGRRSIGIARCSSGRPRGGGPDGWAIRRTIPGAVLISQSAKRLYLILDAETAIAYPVAVARRGKEWRGPARVAGKFVEPAWSPPESVKRDHPELPEVIPGGAPANPMGARAITLDREEIAIHGTTRAMRRSAPLLPMVASAC